MRTGARRRHRRQAEIRLRRAGEPHLRPRVEAPGAPARHHALMRSAPRLADWQVTCVVTAAALMGAAVGPMAPGMRVLAVAHAVIHGVPLLWRRTWPVATLAATTGIVLAGVALGVPSVGSEFAPLAAAYAVGAYAPVSRHVAAAVAAVALGLAGTAPAVGTGAGGPGPLERMLSAAAVFGLALLLGRVVRGRRDLAEQRTLQAVRAERTRIARELHDVVAHHVGAMVIQAGAARRVLDQRPDRAREALEDIERAGREALEAMPALLGALREEGEAEAREPAVSLDRLDELVQRMRGLGLTVHVAVEGERRPLPPGVDLSAYRVVQEALTNAAKHAGPARVDVRVRHEADAVTVVVEDDGRGPADGFDGRGHGLLGMRERAALLGGALDAGARPGGGFRVEARFPLRAGGSP